VRWLVKLEGADAEVFPFWFPDGDVHAVAIDDTVYLAGPLFERLSGPVEVHHVALDVLDEFFAVASLSDLSIVRPRLDIVVRERDDGRREPWVGGSGVASLPRLRYGGRAQSPTQAQTYRLGLGAKRHLDIAVCLWANPERAWWRLYRIMDEIEAYLSVSVSKAELCSDNERDRFTHSANHPAAAGNDARHSGEKRDPPKDPMSLEEAISFVAKLLSLALSLAASAQSSEAT
jgi:hypothetical protein